MVKKHQVLKLLSKSQYVNVLMRLTMFRITIDIYQPTNLLVQIVKHCEIIIFNSGVELCN
ncbi:hypothetical protein C4882_14340 [Cronobacter malonaticus]|nr:hypothetical protein C4882_14340 [Cronobacter malonaticus]